ncbi:MAG: carbohydrate ABC transporter permease [Acetivibrionales bacterium]|jgi:multiple sugar transport system permease protein
MKKLNSSTDILSIPGALPARKKRIDIFPYAISAPAMLFLFVGMLFPILWPLIHSFTDKHVGDKAVFTGFDNYIYILKDTVYINSIKNTVIFTAGAMVGKVLIGIIVALILNMNIKFRNTLRTLYLLPWTLPSVVAIYAWMWLYTGNGGLINNILLQAGILSKPIGWLSSANLSIVSLMIVNIWRGIPFIALTVLSGLQTIPDELYEASRIDGAGTVKAFWHITLPLVKSVILVATLISTIWTLNDFETVYLLTGGGPGQSTTTIPIAAYNFAFSSVYGHIGRASAAALLTVPVLVELMLPVLNNLLGEDKSQARKMKNMWKNISPGTPISGHKVGAEP